MAGACHWRSSGRIRWRIKALFRHWWLGHRSRTHYFSNWRSQFGSADDRTNAFSLFDNWVTRFHTGEREYGAKAPLINDRDERIVACAQVLPVTGRRVIELGPLEAGHTKQLLDLGAASVHAIEANPESYLKCLVAKEALGLTAAHFTLGDFNLVLDRALHAEESYDVCAAIGVLYHMKDPLRTIARICHIAPAVFVWTHVASERAPNGEWLELTDASGCAYRGRRNYYGRERHLGGVDGSAVWLDQASLAAAFAANGFELEWLASEAHANGDTVTLVGRRIPNP